MSKNIAFVPIRKGSKSIINKNIKPFCGQPLVYWVIRALENSKSIDKVVLASNIPKIFEILSPYNFKKIEYFERSDQNAQDESTTESVLLEYLNLEKHSPNDKIILTQVTSPFTLPNDFDKALIKMNQGNLDSIFSCVEFKRFLWDKNSKPINYDFKFRPRRQDFDGVLLENGAFYISSIEKIMKSKNRISGKIGNYIMPEFTYIEIDEIDDWIIAETLMKKYCIKNTLSSEIKYLFSDVDGVLTDSGMYYFNSNDESKKFNTRDGYAFEMLSQKGIKTGIITGEKTKIVEKRAKKLKLDFLFQGVKDKLQLINKFCYDNNVDINSIGFIGDDVNDLNLLSALKFKACPNDAVDSIKQIPNIHILSKSGGDGVVREYVEYLLKNE
tara:strand:+ start:2274 stop:3428 length:1155 start_codon:yes stop_codon:yes gene_type:complete